MLCFIKFLLFQNMSMDFTKKHKSFIFKFLSGFMVGNLLMATVISPTRSDASRILPLPAVSTILSLTPSYNPTILSGITIHPEDPFKIDFIVDVGDDDFQGKELREESQRLISYFLTSMTVPEEEMWVNLSPYEKDRIMADGLGQTRLGLDMLAQDYILKQITASLMYPDSELGRKFWRKIYTQAQEKFGTIDIPTNTFNKVWIVPEKALIYRNGKNIFITDSHLKVMLEEDYLSLEHHEEALDAHTADTSLKEETKIILRDVILPELQREVNEGANFANLRQIYHSLILAVWYKNNLKESILSQIYADENKLEGVKAEDREIKEKIYNQYIDAFKKGVYDYIREDYDATRQEMIPRKYFSGGEALMTTNEVTTESNDKAMLVDSPLALRLEAGNKFVVVENRFQPKTGKEDIEKSDQAMVIGSDEILGMLKEETRRGITRLKPRNRDDYDKTTLLYLTLIFTGIITDPEGKTAQTILVEDDPAKYGLNTQRLTGLKEFAQKGSSLPYQDIVDFFETIDQEQRKGYQAAYNYLRPFGFVPEGLLEEEKEKNNPYLVNRPSPRRGLRVKFVAQRWPGDDPEQIGLLLEALEDPDYWKNIPPAEVPVYQALSAYMEGLRDQSEQEIVSKLRTALRTQLMEGIVSVSPQNDRIPVEQINAALTQAFYNLASKIGMDEVIDEAEAQMDVSTPEENEEVETPPQVLKIVKLNPTPSEAVSYVPEVQKMMRSVIAQSLEQGRPRIHVLSEHYYHPNDFYMLLAERFKVDGMTELNNYFKIGEKRGVAEKRLGKEIGKQKAEIQVLRNFWRVLNLFELYLSLAGESVTMENIQGMLNDGFQQTGLFDAMLSARDGDHFKEILQATSALLYVDEAFTEAADRQRSGRSLSCAEHLYLVSAKMFPFFRSNDVESWTEQRGLLFKLLGEQIPLFMIYLAQEGVYNGFPAHQWGKWTDSSVGQATLSELFYSDVTAKYINRVVAVEHRPLLATYAALAGLQTAPHFYQLEQALADVEAVKKKGLFVLSDDPSTMDFLQAARARLTVLGLSSKETKQRFWPGRIRDPDLFLHHARDLGQELVVIQEDKALNPVEQAQKFVDAFRAYQAVIPSEAKFEDHEFLSVAGFLRQINRQKLLAHIEEDYSFISGVIQSLGRLIPHEATGLQANAQNILQKDLSLFEKFNEFIDLLDTLELFPTEARLSIQGELYSHNQLQRHLQDRWFHLQRNFSILYDYLYLLSLLVNEQVVTVDYHLILHLEKRDPMHPHRLPRFQRAATGKVVARRFFKYPRGKISPQYFVDIPTPLGSSVYLDHRDELARMELSIHQYIEKKGDGSRQPVSITVIENIIERLDVSAGVIYIDQKRELAKEIGFPLEDVVASSANHEEGHAWDMENQITARLQRDPAFLARLFSVMNQYASSDVIAHLSQIYWALAYNSICLFLEDFYAQDTRFQQYEPGIVGETLSIPANPIGYAQDIFSGERESDIPADLILRYNQVLGWVRQMPDVRMQIAADPLLFINTRARLSTLSPSPYFNLLTENFPSRVDYLLKTFQGTPNVAAFIAERFFSPFERFLQELLAVFKEAHHYPQVSQAFRQAHPLDSFEYVAAISIVHSLLAEVAEENQEAHFRRNFYDLFNIPLTDPQQEFWMLPGEGDMIRDVYKKIEQRDQAMSVEISSGKSFSLKGENRFVSQKPIGSKMSKKDIQKILPIEQSKKLSKKEILLLAKQLHLGKQDQERGFNDAFPKFKEDVKFIQNLLGNFSIGKLINFVKRTKEPSTPRISIYEISEELIDESTGLPIAAISYANHQANTLDVYIKKGNAVGLFHEIYEQVVLPLNYPDVIKESERHTVATLAETGLGDAIVSQRFEEQLNRMTNEQIRTFISEALDVSKKINKLSGYYIESYAAKHAEELHEYAVSLLFQRWKVVPSLRMVNISKDVKSELSQSLNSLRQSRSIYDTNSYSSFSNLRSKRMRAFRDISTISSIFGVSFKDFFYPRERQKGMQIAFLNLVKSGEWDLLLQILEEIKVRFPTAFESDEDFNLFVSFEGYLYLEASLFGDPIPQLENESEDSQISLSAVFRLLRLAKEVNLLNGDNLKNFINDYREKFDLTEEWTLVKDLDPDMNLREAIWRLLQRKGQLMDFFSFDSFSAALYIREDGTFFLKKNYSSWNYKTFETNTDLNDPLREMLGFHIGHRIGANVTKTVITSDNIFSEVMSIDPSKYLLPQATMQKAEAANLVLTVFIRTMDDFKEMIYKAPVGETFVKFNHDKSFDKDFLNFSQFVDFQELDLDEDSPWNVSDFDSQVIWQTIKRVQSLNIDDLVKNLREQIQNEFDEERLKKLEIYRKFLLRTQKSIEEDVKMFYREITGHDLPLPEVSDFAMPVKQEEFGGIDFNSNNLDFTERGEVADFQFHNPPGMESLSIKGMHSVILNISPITNFHILLGLT